jgi:hypothetical protein
MYFRLLLKLIIIVALTIIQIGFVSGLPPWASQLNLIIIFLVFYLEFSKDGKMIWWLVLVGFFFDIYLPFFFGFFMILWPLVYLFAAFLSANFFTNRSLYSFLGLTFFTAVFYSLVFNLLFYFQALFSENKTPLFILSKNFWLSTGEAALVNLLAVIILFYLVNLASDRLKPVFIIKK